MSIIAERMLTLKPSPTLAITQKAKELKASGKDVIGLGAGEPDFDTPSNIKKSAKLAIDNGHTKYTAVCGIPQLKNAIIAKLNRDNNLGYKPENIIVSTGGKQVIFNAMIASINPQDEVIIPAPYWVSYPDIVTFSGGVPVIIKCDDSASFKITPKQLQSAITPKTKWLILNSPSNPTGSCYTKSELQELGKVLLKFPHVHVMSDDIYEHLVYDETKFYNIKTLVPQLADRVLIINGVSKAYSMTGWRIGYGAGNAELIKAMSKIQSQSTSNPCSIAQHAALEALDGPQDFIATNNEIFARRRDLVVKLLNEIPEVECLTPNGAFYLYPNISGVIGKTTKSGEKINNCSDFAKYLLDDAMVAVVPGIAFGLENYVRISYATSDDLLVKACERISRAISNLI